MAFFIISVAKADIRNPLTLLAYNLIATTWHFKTGKSLPPLTEGGGLP